LPLRNGNDNFQFRPVRKISRRDALRHLSAGALLAAGLWPGALRAADRGYNAKFRFVVVNDTHLITPECGPWLDGAVRQMKTEAPEFCLNCGDLTDKGQRPHLEQLKEVFRGLGEPMYPVIGNHDYFAPGDRQPYVDTFRLRINYYFRHRGWQFIGLDTSEGQKYENTLIQPATFEWLTDNLGRLDPRAPTVLFTHFPLGAGVTYRPSNADALLDRFREFNLQAVFSGHYHGFTEKKSGPFSLTTNRCCALSRNNHDGTKEKGYFVCEASDGKLTRRFVEYKPEAKS
jgi:3',5'-cyclic AMP phosphodiesterase CpdA